MDDVRERKKLGLVEVISYGYGYGYRIYIIGVVRIVYKATGGSKEINNSKYLNSPPN